MLGHLVILVVTALLTFPTAGAQAQVQQAAGAGLPNTIIIIRHADRLNGSEDSPLSQRGEERAQALVKELHGRPLDGIVTSQRLRTIQTAKPLAAKRELASIPAEYSNKRRYFAAVRSSLAPFKDGAVLIVSHSEVVGALIGALGGPQGLPRVCGSVYDHLFIVTPGAAEPLLRLRYGRPTPTPPGQGCM